MYGSLAESSLATPDCWEPRRKTFDRDCPFFHLCVGSIFFRFGLCVWSSWGEAGLDPSLGRAGGRVALPALLPPAALYGWYIRREGKRGRALPGTTAIPTLIV